MNLRYFAVGIAVSAWSVSAAAADPVAQACATGTQSGTAFTPAKRLCLETLIAHGRYQDVVDRVETQDLGLAAQEQYFLGKAYFGLSNRTGAHALKCHYFGRARELLEAFLTDRRDLYRKQASFGTTDDMKYVADATKTAEVLRSLEGCEQSAHTQLSLERYARRYAATTLEGLFYKDGSVTNAELQRVFSEKTGSLESVMRQFVETASRVESRYGVALAEIDAGKSYLQLIQSKINSQFQSSGLPNDPLRVACSGGVVLASEELIGEKDSFPKFSYVAGCTASVFGFLKNRTNYFSDMISAEKGGKIGLIEKEIREVIGAQSMEDYAAQKERTYNETLALSDALFVRVNFGVALSKQQGPGKLSESIGSESPNQLHRGVRHLISNWKDQMREYCSATAPRWYCGAGAQP